MIISSKPNTITKTLDTTIKITDQEELERLINDLRAAMDRSRHTGGEYMVEIKNGVKRLVFNIHLSWRL